MEWGCCWDTLKVTLGALPLFSGDVMAYKGVGLAPCCGHQWDSLHWSNTTASQLFTPTDGPPVTPAASQLFLNKQKP